MADWTREHFEPGGGDAFLMYCIFGRFPEAPSCSGKRYRTRGVPAGIAMGPRRRDKEPEQFAVWCEGYFGDQLRRSGLESVVGDAPDMLVVQGTISDPEDLTYLRDTIGIVTCLLDSGGVAVLDPQILHWWSPTAWRKTIFDPDEPRPRQHAVILFSDDDAPGTRWYHTRGMRKFGRPDLSVRRVPADYTDATVDMLERFIELEAFGGVIPEGHAIRMKSLPSGMTCRHAGDLDDPDFNNVHIEIDRP